MRAARSRCSRPDKSSHSGDAGCRPSKSATRSSARPVAEGIYEWDIERNLLSPSAPVDRDVWVRRPAASARPIGTGIVHPEDFPIYRAALRDCFRGRDGRGLDLASIALPAQRWRLSLDRGPGPARSANEAGPGDPAGRRNQRRDRAKKTTEAGAGATTRSAFPRQPSPFAEGILRLKCPKRTRLFVSPRLMERSSSSKAPGSAPRTGTRWVHARPIAKPYRSAPPQTASGALAPRVACELPHPLNGSGEYRWVEGPTGLPIRKAAGRRPSGSWVPSATSPDRKEEANGRCRRPWSSRPRPPRSWRVHLQFADRRPADLRGDRCCCEDNCADAAASGAVFTFDGTLIHLVRRRWLDAKTNSAMISSTFPDPARARQASTARANRGRGQSRMSTIWPRNPDYGYPSLAQSGGNTVAPAVPMLRDRQPDRARSMSQRPPCPSRSPEKQIDLLKDLRRPGGDRDRECPGCSNELKRSHRRSPGNRSKYQTATKRRLEG